MTFNQYWPSIICSECNEIMIRTDRGAVLCPKGCVKVLAISLSARQFNAEARQIAISRLPAARHVKCGRWQVDDRPGVFYRIPKGTPGAVTFACERSGGRIVAYFHTEPALKKQQPAKPRQAEMPFGGKEQPNATTHRKTGQPKASKGV